MKTLLLLLAFFSSTCLAFAVSEIPLDFKSDGLQLNATLSVPDGDGPFPLAIFIHGSGPNDRDLTVVMNGGNFSCLYPGLDGSTLRMFRDLAEDLGARGIAVLRYDKRTFTHASELDAATISPYDFARDVHAAIDAVKQRPEVDTRAIILAGASQGSTLAPIVAAQRTDIAALVSLAGPGRPIDSALADQVRHITRECGDPDLAEPAAQQTLATFRAMRDGSWPDNQPYLGAFPLFWKDWMGITDSAITHFILAGRPVLFLQGTDDFNVLIADVERLRDGVNGDTKTVIFNGLNHFFTPAETPRVPAAVADTIAAWLQGVLPGTTSVAEGEVHPFAEPRLSQTDEGFIVVPGQDHLPSAAQLFDINGRLLHTYDVVSGHIRGNTSGLRSGMYFLRIENGATISSLQLHVSR